MPDIKYNIFTCYSKNREKLFVILKLISKFARHYERHAHITNVRNSFRKQFKEDIK